MSLFEFDDDFPRRKTKFDEWEEIFEDSDQLHFYDQENDAFYFYFEYDKGWHIRFSDAIRTWYKHFDTRSGMFDFMKESIISENGDIKSFNKFIRELKAKEIFRSK